MHISVWNVCIKEMYYYYHLSWNPVSCPLPWWGVSCADGPASRPPWGLVRTPRSGSCWSCEGPAGEEGKRCCIEPGSRETVRWGWNAPRHVQRCCPWSLCWATCHNDPQLEAQQQEEKGKSLTFSVMVIKLQLYSKIARSAISKKQQKCFVLFCYYGAHSQPNNTF